MGGGILEVLKIAKYGLLDPYGPLGTPKPLPGSCFRIVRHLISDSVGCQLKGMSWPTAVNSKLMNQLMMYKTTPKRTFSGQIDILRRARRAALENILRRTIL